MELDQPQQQTGCPGGEAAPPRPRSERLLLAALVGIFCGVLMLLPAQAWLRFLPPARLAGVAVPPDPPGLSWKTFATGTFQQGVETWCLKRNGLWGWMVRIGNEICYRVFGQVSPRYNPGVLAGREGSLFQPMYLDGINKQLVPALPELRARVRKLKRLQERLERRGIRQILMINPNLMALYPELLPGQYRDPTAAGRPSTYDLFLPLLDRAGVNYVDVYGSLLKLKGTSPIPFIEPTGSHLNAVGSCLATNLLLAGMEELSGRAMPRLTCEPWRMVYPPRPRERDLVEIANLLAPEALYRPAPYPEVALAGDNSGFRPKVLFVGTSFLFAPVTHLYEQKLVGESYLSFYYRSGSRLGGSSFASIPRAAIDWQTFLLDKDFLVLESNQSYPEIAGFGFVDDALRKVK